MTGLSFHIVERAASVKATTLSSPQPYILHPSGPSSLIYLIPFLLLHCNPHPPYSTPFPAPPIARHSRLEGLALLGIVCSAGDHPQEVVRQHERHPLPADAELLLEVA